MNSMPRTEQLWEGRTDRKCSAMLDLGGSALHDLLAGELLTVSRGGFPAGEGHGPTQFRGLLTAGPCADAQRSPPCSALRSDTPAVAAFLWPPFPRASARSFPPPSTVVLRRRGSYLAWDSSRGSVVTWGLGVWKVQGYHFPAAVA